MEENNFNEEQINEEQTSEDIIKTNFTTVTPLSKYFALILFIALPFIGGWVGYKYSPEKIVDVEKIVFQEIQKVEENQNFETLSEEKGINRYIDKQRDFSFIYPEGWDFEKIEHTNWTETLFKDADGISVMHLYTPPREIGHEFAVFQYDSNFEVKGSSHMIKQTFYKDPVFALAYWNPGDWSKAVEFSFSKFLVEHEEGRYVANILETFSVAESQEENINKENLPSHTLNNSNWVTYESAKYGVSFRHNPNWEVRVVEGSTADNILIIVDDSSIISLGVFHGQKDLATHVSEALNLSCEGCEYQKPREYMMSDGTEVFEVYAFDTFNKVSMLGDFYFTNNNTVFWLHGDSAVEETKAVLETIVIK